MDKEISLELDHGNYPMAVSTSESKRSPDYPTFHYDGKEELNLPDKGEITVRFRKVSETSSVTKAGEHRYACTIEVQAICDVEGEEDSTDAYDQKNSVENILDGLMEKLQKGKE